MPAGLFKGGQDIAGLAACCDRDEHITGLSKSRHLTGKDLIELIIIANGGQQTRIDRESHGGVGTSVLLEPAGELSGQMGAIACASSMSTEHQLVPCKESITGQGGGFFQGGFQGSQCLEHIHHGSQ